MKVWRTLMKLAAAVAAVAGIAFLVVKYFDQIKQWLSRFCPCCDYTLEDDFEPDFYETSTPGAAPEQPPVEEAPAEDADPLTAEADDFEEE